MYEGETREIDNAELVADLTKAGYIEEIKKARTRGRSAKKSGDTNPQE